MLKTHRKKALSIFLVEDDTLDHEWFKTLLARIPNLSFELSWVQNQAEASLVLAENTFDIVAIDFAIGPYSGIDLISELGGRDATSPMIMLTGDNRYETDVAAMQAGAYDYLDKATLDSLTLERSLRYVLEARRLENELKLARDKAQLASDAKSTFLSNMSHDLRTPLNAIIGFSEFLLGSSSLDAEAKEQLGFIHASGQHLSSMISDLILLAQFETDAVRLETQSCEISGLIPSVINATQYAARERNVYVHYVADDTINLTVTADQKALYRMLMNLLASACDLTKMGHQVTLLTTGTPEGLTITMSGPCEQLSEVPLMQMTQPFAVPGAEYAAESVYRVGLSLAIAYRYAQLHSTRLAVNPQPNGEMCFSLFFPANTASAAPNQRHIL